MLVVSITLNRATLNVDLKRGQSGFTGIARALSEIPPWPSPVQARLAVDPRRVTLRSQIASSLLNSAEADQEHTEAESRSMIDSRP